MKMYTYVNFAGKCAEAFHFYEKHLDAKIGNIDDARTGPRPDAGQS